MKKIEEENMDDGHLPKRDEKIDVDYQLEDDYSLDEEIEIAHVQNIDDKPKQKESQAKQKKDTHKTGNAKPQKQTKKNGFWVARIFILTFFLSVLFTVITESVLSGKSLLLAFIILFLLLAVNILFDIVGTAAASCNIEPFISKASRKDKHAVVAVKLLKNAEKVTNFCNDVVGDICGIVSGGCVGAIVLLIATGSDKVTFILSVVFSSVISALTVGGKALGKSVGMKKNEQIIMSVAKLLSVFKK